MDWYYAIGTERNGPVDDAEVQRLAQAGVITAETLVWREGLSDWQPHGQIAAPALPGSAPIGTVVCASCGDRLPEHDAFSLAGQHYCATCKAQVLERIKEGKPPISASAEETRRRFIKYEASVKSIGLLYYLGGAILVFMGASELINAFGAKGTAGQLIYGGFLVILAAVQIWTGTGVRRLQPWSRIAVGILSGFGALITFLGVASGTNNPGASAGIVVNIYIIYLVFCAKSATVFSPEYQAVIQQTPHIKYRISIVIWVLLALVLLLVLLAASAAIFGTH